MTTITATDEILSVKRFSWDGDSYVVRCAHCNKVIGIEGRVPSDVRGEQYKHPACGGWIEVDTRAKEVTEV